NCSGSRGMNKCDSPSQMRPHQPGGTMTRHLVCSAIAAIVIFSSQRALADVAYVTVDAVETSSAGLISSTRIVSGDPTPSTRFVNVSSSTSITDGANRCDRLALLAMSKPGKFQLVMVGPSSSLFECKLVLRAP